jgi:hypothetical protein
MPHYFFHVRNGNLSSLDDEGGDFDDFAAAEREAVLSVRDLMIEALKNGEPVIGWRVEIADEDGKVLNSVPAQRILH